MKENAVLTAIRKRRSIRKFKPDMPSREDIDAIMEAGLYAPSGMGKQSSIVVAVTDRETRDRLSHLNQEVVGGDTSKDPFYGGPVVLIVLGDKTQRNYLYDGSLTMGNMLLAAHALGLGGIWIHRAKQEFESEEGKALLKKWGIEGDYEGIGHCVVGYVDGEPPVAAPRKENRVYFVK